MENNSVRCVVQSMPAQTATPNGTQAFTHLKGAITAYSIRKTVDFRLLVPLQKKKKQTDQCIHRTQ